LKRFVWISSDAKGAPDSVIISPKESSHFMFALISSPRRKRASVAKMFSVFGAIALCLSWVVGARAQGAASLTGHVFDQNGAAVSAATVTLKPQEPASATSARERSARADALGRFSFAELVPGTYRLTASGEGFAIGSEDVTITEGARTESDITLNLARIAEEVAITSTQIIGDTESQRRIPGTVDVLDRRTLETSRVFTFTEALRKIPGINVRDEEGFGLRPNIGIRGLNPTRSTKVLLLEDGIPLTYAPYGDNASYYHPPVDRFDSIEVLKGSGQILYGPTTVGGVINYITPNPPVERAGSLTLIGGSRDYFNGRANYGGTFGRTGLAL
jgi:Fe(3+) dicitrate transport protein